MISTSISRDLHTPFLVQGCLLTSFPEPAQFKNLSSRTFEHQLDHRVFLETPAAQVWVGRELGQESCKETIELYLGNPCYLRLFLLPFSQLSTMVSIRRSLRFYHSKNKQVRNRCRVLPGAVRHHLRLLSASLQPQFCRVLLLRF